MNTKQQDAWRDLVRQCKIQCTEPFYSSINVASRIRSEAIVAAGELVELVTPELAEMLEVLANATENDEIYALAARIREALEEAE